MARDQKLMFPPGWVAQCQHRGPAAGRENEQPHWNTIVCGTLRASRAQDGALLRKRKWVVNDGGVSLEGMAKVSQETNCVDCIYRFLFDCS